MSTDPLNRCCPGPGGSATQEISRRDLLRHAGFGFGSLALAGLLAEEGLLAAESELLRPRAPHFQPRARRVIFLFMSGGPSHLETFDPKPDLQRLHGEPLPASFGPVQTRRGVEKNRLLATKRTFTPAGKSGIEVSDLLPHLSRVIDELALLRGCYGDSVTHPESVYLMNTGSILMGRPSLGSWLGYGLGSESRNLPGFVVMPDPDGWVKGGSPAWRSGFMPGVYSGTVIRGGSTPVANLRPPDDVSEARRRSQLNLLRDLNQEHLGKRGGDDRLAARIAAYELAFRMQSHAPEVFDISREPLSVREAYGVDRQECGEFAGRCLLARRLVEAGVRTVQLYCGGTNGWDGHSNIEENHRTHCLRMDRPVAALLRDLRQRGLLEDTLVVWAGEFGRTPMSEGKDGRDHNPHGFSIWMAGAGIRGGMVHGATDAIGLRAAEGRTHVHDIHATILHLMGLNHRRLAFMHNGRAERLTDVAGEVIQPILA